MFSTAYTHEQVNQRVSDAIVEVAATSQVAYAVTLPVLPDDRAIAEACAERHEKKNCRFAHQPKFYRGKNHFATIVRGYIGEVVVRRALGQPHSIDDLVFDTPQRRPDLMRLASVEVTMDVKTTEDGTVRINQESHFKVAKRPVAYVLADVRADQAHVWVVDADAVDTWHLKPHPSPHYLRELPPPPLQ